MGFDFCSKRRFSALALAVFISSACAAESDGQHPIRIGPHALQVEVAATSQQRERGLMGRTRLPENGGMLFVFDTTRRHCFWMRNTPLPLSIAFIDEAGRILNIADMQPHTDTLHCPTIAIRYALEVSQGKFAQRGIIAGNQVDGLPQ
ncbi:MAG: DUF192 domain-containing protein [Thiobacillus sp.]|nr:DUF192 domain-containing protein [Thiobacillus sp.]